MKKLLILSTATFLLSPSGLFSANNSLQSLLENSPFGHTPTVSQLESQVPPLEFMGLMVENETTFFSIYDPESKRSSWARLQEESKLDFKIIQYDKILRQITLTHRGDTIILTLDSMWGRPTVRDEEGKPHLVANHRGSSAPKPPRLASETHRLSNIASEIKRRRALRQQKIEQTRR